MVVSPKLYDSTSSSYDPFSDSNSHAMIKKENLPPFAELLKDIEHSKVLNADEKRLYSQMVNCVATFGTDSDIELFNAADYAFDLDFGSDYPHNIITIKNYISMMGDELKDNLGENDYISSDIFAHDRPGFFLLTPNKDVYFLKEGSDANLLLYDPQKDVFIESHSLPISGEEKLVIPNKSTQPQMDTYFGIHTPDRPIEGKFYHEKQDSGKCVVHAAHAFLGFPVINETQLSLMKLEELNNLEWSSLIEKPDGQVIENLNSNRFQFVQTASIRADLGNEAHDIIMILKYLAAKGIIDKKYQDVRLYSIRIGRVAVEYALSKHLYVQGQEWNEELSQKVLEEVKRDVESNRETLEKLDRQIENMRLENIRIGFNHREHHYTHPRYQEYMQLEIAKGPYKNLINLKEKLEESMKTMQELRNVFEKSDRLLIASVSELHGYSMRKCENGDWIVIDSMNSEQLRVHDPLEWLTSRQMSFFHVSQYFHYEFVSLAS